MVADDLEPFLQSIGDFQFIVNHNVDNFPASHAYQMMMRLSIRIKPSLLRIDRKLLKYTIFGQCSQSVIYS